MSRPCMQSHTKKKKKKERKINNQKKWTTTKISHLFPDFWPSFIHYHLPTPCRVPGLQRMPRGSPGSHARGSAWSGLLVGIMKHWWRGWNSGGFNNTELLKWVFLLRRKCGRRVMETSHSSPMSRCPWSYSLRGFWLFSVLGSLWILRKLVKTVSSCFWAHWTEHQTDRERDKPMIPLCCEEH